MVNNIEQEIYKFREISVPDILDWKYENKINNCTNINININNSQNISSTNSSKDESSDDTSSIISGKSNPCKKTHAKCIFDGCVKYARKSGFNQYCMKHLPKDCKKKMLIMPSKNCSISLWIM